MKRLLRNGDTVELVSPTNAEALDYWRDRGITILPIYRGVVVRDELEELGYQIVQVKTDAPWAVGGIVQTAADRLQKVNL